MLGTPVDRSQQTGNVGRRQLTLAGSTPGGHILRLKCTTLDFWCLSVCATAR